VLKTRDTWLSIEFKRSLNTRHPNVKMSPDASSEVSSDDVVVMIYKDERVLVPRPDSYEVRNEFLIYVT
jgi:hypothetical protein